jgi:hypothetical protein
MKRLLNVLLMIIVMASTLTINILPVSAKPNRPVLVLPMPIDQLGNVKYSQGPHPSDFKSKGANSIVIKNAGTKVLSSIDFSYAGKVVAPISGKVKVFADCGSGGQILFIWDGANFAMGVTHIKSAVSHNTSVTQGQYIGDTIAPQNNNCGYAPAHHVHLTLLTSTDGKNFSELDITGTRFGQWELNADRSMRSIWTGNVLWDYNKSSTRYSFIDTAKITSVRSGNVIEADSSGTKLGKYSSGNKNQQWILIPALNDPDYYYLKNVSRGQCMIAPNNNNGTPITISSCWKDHQKFKFVAISGSSNKFAIQSKMSKKVLDVPTNWSDENSGKAPGTRIQQWDPFYGNNQQWTFSKP